MTENGVFIDWHITQMTESGSSLTDTQHKWHVQCSVVQCSTSGSQHLIKGMQSKRMLLSVGTLVCGRQLRSTAQHHGCMCDEARDGQNVALK